MRQRTKELLLACDIVEQQTSQGEQVCIEREELIELRDEIKDLADTQGKLVKALQGFINGVQTNAITSNEDERLAFVMNEALDAIKGAGL